jgi:glutathione S-transferase
MAQGPARLTRAERTEQMQQGLGALSQLLGSQRYLTGDQPTEADAVLFAFLDNLFFDGLPGIVTQAYRQLGLQHENLLAFTQRLRSQLYPDAPQGATGMAEQ